MVMYKDRLMELLAFIITLMSWKNFIHNTIYVCSFPFLFKYENKAILAKFKCVLYFSLTHNTQRYTCWTGNTGKTHIDANLEGKSYTTYFFNLVVLRAAWVWILPIHTHEECQSPIHLFIVDSFTLGVVYTSPHL